MTGSQFAVLMVGVVSVLGIAAWFLVDTYFARYEEEIQREIDKIMGRDHDPK